MMRARRFLVLLTATALMALPVAASAQTPGPVEDLIGRCPPKAEVAALDADLTISFEGVDPSGTALVCRTSAGSVDSTRFQERAYQALRVMKAIRFSRPLPWISPSQTLYGWFIDSIDGIRFRSDITTSFCCDPAGVIDIVAASNSAALFTNRWIDQNAPLGLTDLVTVLVHEARHNNGKPHTCGNDDQTVGELGAWGVDYYLELWDALYTGAFLTPPDVYPSYYRDQHLLRSESAYLPRICTLPNADLSLAVGAPSGSAVRGQNVTYSFTVANSGPDSAGDTYLYSPKPLGTTFVSASTSQGSCSAGGNGPIACTLGAIGSGASVTAAVTLHVDPATSVTEITNRESATAPGARVTGPYRDANPANNSATFSTPLAPSDVTPPRLTLPTTKKGAPGVIATATSGAGARVGFAVTATDDSGLPPAVDCTPRSGTVFRPGTTTVRCVGTDASGNSAAGRFPVTVTFAFGPHGGFASPVKNPPQVNIRKAGTAVRVRFSLGGNMGLAVLAAGAPISRRVSCSDGTSTAAPQRTAGASSPALKYDPTAGVYTYFWKAKKIWAGTCRRLDVILTDNTHHTALFRFR